MAVSPGVRKLVTITVPAFAVVTLLMMIATEVWVRLTIRTEGGTPGFYQSDPMHRQRLAPNYAGCFAGVPVRINSFGLRDDREYDLRKRPNTFRILVLGDSVTFGHGAVHPYPALLEDPLCAWRGGCGRCGSRRCRATTRARSWRICSRSVPPFNPIS